jgi:hypothetical protein
MIKKTQINDKVRKVLERRINAIKRLNTETGEDFFIGDSLEPQDTTNPLEQHLYRSCFAKVSIPSEVLNDETEVITPRYLSSYMNLTEEGILNQTDIPLSFLNSKDESPQNRFRGHAGITKISVQQQNYFTYKMQIDWHCPDPVFFEKEFEPFFLKLGTYCSVEFGWGINDSNVELPDLDVDSMKSLLEGIEDRNLESAGNYYCNIGIVTKFDWKINTDGTYSGNIILVSPSVNALAETTDESDGKTEPNINKVKNLQEKVKLGQNLLKSKTLTKEQKEELILVQAEISTLLNDLKKNSITFQNTIKNLDSVLDAYLGVPDLDREIGGGTYAAVGAAGGAASFVTGGTAFPAAVGALALTGLVDILQLDKLYEITAEKIQESLTEKQSTLRFKDSPYNLRKMGAAVQSEIDYLFKDGAMRMIPIARYLKPNDTVPEKLKKRYFVSWGWFEDVVLSTFFELNTKETSENPKELIQEIYSATKEDNVDSLNLCQSHEYLYSMGLDFTILPGKHHPILNSGFNNLTQKEKNRAKRFYTKEQRNNLARIYHMYKVIDENFKPFENSKSVVRPRTGPKGEKIQQNSKGKHYYIPKDDPNSAVIVQKNKQAGVIRNMVFPIELLQKHFGAMSSLKSAMTNFWADVNNQYGGFWDFKIGQDQDKTQRIGVSDLLLDEGDSDRDEMFEFPIYSNDSIVKSFDVSLKLTAEAATQARYGVYSSNSNNQKTDGKKDLGVQAWTLLNNANYNESREDKTLEDKKFEKFRKDDVYKQIAYPNDKGKSKNYILQYTKDNILQTRFMGNEGFNFGDVPLVKDDDEKELEKVENQRTEFIKGIGVYDKYGNFSSYFKSTMNYILNQATEENATSNLVQSSPPIPVEISMTLDGIGGLRPGNQFTVDYLPKRYREHCHFMITKVNHDIGTSGWETSIDAIMIADLKAFWEERPLSKKPAADYDKLFKLTTIGLDNLALVGAEPGGRIKKKQTKFDTQINDINQALADFQNADGLFGGNAKRWKAFQKLKFNTFQARNKFARYENFGADIVDDKIEELRLIYNQKMIEVRGVLNNYDGYKDTEHPDWYSADGSFQSIPEEGFGGVRVAAFRGSGAETTIE